MCLLHQFLWIIYHISVDHYVRVEPLSSSFENHIHQLGAHSFWEQTITYQAETELDFIASSWNGYLNECNIWLTVGKIWAFILVIIFMSHFETIFPAY